MKVVKMFRSVHRLKGMSSSFVRDERGTISTEWLVAVGIVVSMAVPVLAVISDGSEHSTEDMIVSIQETDSFGGGGLQPGDSTGSATWNGDELYVPGANLGIGYGDEDQSAVQAVTSSDEDAEKPRYFDYTAALARGGRGSSGGGGGGGINLMTSGGGGGGSAGTSALPAIAASAPAPSAPSGVGAAPATGRDNLALRSEHCFDENGVVHEPRYANYVVASGR